MVRISRGQVVLANPQYFKPSDDVISKEISIQKYTNIEILGSWIQEEEKEIFTPINLCDAGNYVGKSISKYPSNT